MREREREREMEEEDDKGGGDRVKERREKTQSRAHLSKTAKSRSLLALVFGTHPVSLSSSWAETSV